MQNNPIEEIVSLLNRLNELNSQYPGIIHSLKIEGTKIIGSINPMPPMELERWVIDNALGELLIDESKMTPEAQQSISQWRERANMFASQRNDG